MEYYTSRSSILVTSGFLNISLDSLNKKSSGILYLLFFFADLSISTFYFLTSSNIFSMFLSSFINLKAFTGPTSVEIIYEVEKITLDRACIIAPTKNTKINELVHIYL